VAGAGRSAAALVDEAAAVVLAAIGEHVWGLDDDTWPAALGRELLARDWDAALVEVGTGGATARLLGEATWLRTARVIAAGSSGAEAALSEVATQARGDSGASIGLAVRAIETAEDTRVELAAAGPWGVSETSQTAFLGGSEGRRRAGLAAAAFLYGILHEAAGG
jgi:hypothetical protein